jgi:hypothetical protein
MGYDGGAAATSPDTTIHVYAEIVLITGLGQWRGRMSRPS